MHPNGYEHSQVRSGESSSKRLARAEMDPARATTAISSTLIATTRAHTARKHLASMTYHKNISEKSEHTRGGVPEAGPASQLGRPACRRSGPLNNKSDHGKRARRLRAWGRTPCVLWTDLGGARRTCQAGRAKPGGAHRASVFLIAE